MRPMVDSTISSVFRRCHVQLTHSGKGCLEEKNGVDKVELIFRTQWLWNLLITGLAESWLNKLYSLKPYSGGGYRLFVRGCCPIVPIALAYSKRSVVAAGGHQHFFLGMLSIVTIRRTFG